MQRCKNADRSDTGAHAEQTAWKESQQEVGSLQEPLTLYLSFPLKSLLCTGADNYTTCRSAGELFSVCGLNFFVVSVGPKSSPFQLSTLRGLKSRDISF